MASQFKEFIAPLAPAFWLCVIISSLTAAFAPNRDGTVFFALLAVLFAIIASYLTLLIIQIRKEDWR